MQLHLKAKMPFFLSPMKTVRGGTDPPFKLSPFWLQMKLFVMKSQQLNGLVWGDGCVDF